MARYKRLKGCEVMFLTGTDEHGQKIEDKAKEAGVTPQQYVDNIVTGPRGVLDLWKLMNISNDRFIRTTDDYHQESVKKIFKKLYDQGDIYKSAYKGKYCTPCESFWTESQLVDGKCPDCGRDVKLVKEESYFFRLSKYQDRLLKYYEEHPEFLEPEKRKNEMVKNFFDKGLEDLCVTRTSFDWGIKVLKDPKHVIYVWVDALTNYLTALGYLSEDDTLFKKYWPADLQVVGKDIARFHLIYWPIFLMALDLPLPKTILVHNWIMMKDGKMSKSKGNVIYPETLIDRYGLDATKYFILKVVPVSQDGVFTPEEFVERYNCDLCNDLSNLLNRTVSMVNKYFSGVVPKYNGTPNDVDKEFEQFTLEQISKFEAKMDEYEISNALQEIWAIVSRTNKYIDETMPWQLAKDEEQKERLESSMYHLIENLRKIAILIKPFMEHTSENILRQIGIQDEKLKTWESLQPYDRIENVKVIEKGEPIFMRLNVEEEIEYLKEAMKA